VILQSLITLYDRLYKEQHEDSENEGAKIPPLGFSMEKLGFCINIDRNGNLIGNPEDIRGEKSAQSYKYRLSEVPYSNQINVRSNNSSTTPNFMVDRADYIFGMSGASRKNVHQNSFRELIDEVCGNSQDEGVLAVKSFLRKWDPSKSTSLPYWQEICGKDGKWVAFKLEGDRGLVHERPEVQKLWENFVGRKEYRRGISLIDGLTHPIQNKYAQFSFGAGASLVSFNKAAYESYGKSRGENAPISVEAEFKSSTALKYLLRSETQCLRIGDATTVFWTERKTPVEPFFGKIINPRSKDEIEPVQKFLEAAKKGILPNNSDRDGEVKFYILGLALNQGRLALRFWYVCSVEKLMRRLGNHFKHLEIDKSSERDIEYPGVWHLLKETARETKDISPVLGGALMRSILTGAPYPMSLYHGVMGRIGADGRINYLRASILKAVLERNFNKEIRMSLDTKNLETAYLLGRLFAVLEKAQQDALGNINTTIRDSFFSAAASTPGSVFPRLLQLSQHHIKKAEYGLISDKRIGEIMENIKGFPPLMDLKDQGLFAIAYYQQRNENYRKKETATEGENNEQAD